MSDLAFPKPIRTRRPRSTLRGRKRERTVRIAEQVEHPKPTVIKDPDLLRSYRRRPCVECSSHLTDAHHYIPRSHQQLDIPENLDPFCWECHGRIERGDFDLELKHFLKKPPRDLFKLYCVAPSAGIWKQIPKEIWEHNYGEEHPSSSL